jgi:glycosyltransferase involved in cell wall biosynthesis
MMHPSSAAARQHSRSAVAESAQKLDERRSRRDETPVVPPASDGISVVYVSSLEAGGPVTHMRDLVPQVVAAGARVRVICQSEDVAASYRTMGVAAHVSPLMSKWDVRGAARIRRLLRGADVVHTEDRRALLLVGVLARACGAQLVHTYHGVPEELGPMVGRSGAGPAAGVSRARLAWIRHGHMRIESSLAHLATVVTPSHAMERFLVSYNFPPERVEVVHSRIDLRRREPGPAHSPLALATAAVLDQNKGIDVLIAACARAAVPTRLHIYGDGDRRAALEEQARRLGVDVTFYGRVKDVRDRLERDVDIFVLPSRGENLPISILEAMAAAVPVIATHVGGIPELVVDGVTGLLVEPDDVGALAGAVEDLARHPTRREELGRGGARRIAECFNSVQTGPIMVELYRKLCASSM